MEAAVAAALSVITDATESGALRTAHRALASAEDAATHVESVDVRQLDGYRERLTGINGVDAPTATLPHTRPLTRQGVAGSPVGASNPIFADHVRHHTPTLHRSRCLRTSDSRCASAHVGDNLKHKRKVAVKVLRPELAAVLGAERFVQETGGDQDHG